MEFQSEQFRVKVGLAEMLKGGVIMDVTDAAQAKIAEDAGAAAVMALERVPADIRAEGGVARMAAIGKIEEIMKLVSIPVMAKCRIGHMAEARVLEALGVDFIDESEVLTPADEENHVWKRDFKVPFVCGCRNLGEALRRIGEGAAMIRTKGEAGSGNIVEAVRHLRAVRREMRRLGTLDAAELVPASKELQAPLELVEYVAKRGQAAGAELRGRRRRHPGRRGSLHDARRRVGVRRLRDLQVRGPVAARRGDRQGGHALAGRGGGAGSVARPRGRHARPRHREAHARGDALAPGVVSAWPLRADRAARAAG